jgi:hypothetical protein
MQLKVDGRLLIHLQDDVLVLDGPEAPGLGLDGINRRPQAGQDVQTVIVAARNLGNACGIVCDGNGCLRKAPLWSVTTPRICAV